jgi:hypothetical protein
MKMSEIENRAYQWIGKNGGWQVGRPLVTDTGEFAASIESECRRHREVLMQPSHASPPTWVPVDELQPYSLEPIEESSVKGGV